MQKPFGSRQGLVEAFDLFFLAVVVAAIIYSCTSDYVFAFFNIVHRRLPRRLRNFWKACYLSGTALIALGCHVALAAMCGTKEPCHDRPLDDRYCTGTLAASILVQIGLMAIDRVAIPLLNLYDQPAFPCTFIDRVIHSSGVCVAWMCVADEETLGILLLLAWTARRTLNYTPRISTLYTGLIKLYVFGHTFLVIHGQCHSKNRALPTAVLGAAFVL